MPGLPKASSQHNNNNMHT